MDQKTATFVQNTAPMGYAYDASGDVTSDNTNTYLYDAEGRICAVRSEPVAGTYTMTGYLYDAGGTRVAKGTITNWSCDPATSGFSTTNDYILGQGGEQMTEMTMNGDGSTLVWEHTNVFAGGKIIATYSQDNTGSQTQNSALHFYLDDPLGSRRVQTDYAGVVEKSCQSLPFGDGETCLATPTEHLFTGKERDAESGNDYFGARYYASSVGRWLSPDWSAKVEPVPYAKTDSPQSLNLYAYVGNNPLVGVDLDGHSGVTEGLRMMAENAAPLDPSLWDKKQPPPPPSTTYDPSKTGPEDPTNPGHPLFQNKTFKKLSDKAFVKTDDGKARNGKAEAGFRIDYVDGKLTFGPIITNANETSADGIPNEIPIPIFIGQTIAILHTHGNEAVVEPSSLDERSPVPNFVRSASFLFVTVPNATKDPYIQLQPTPSR